MNLSQNFIKDSSLVKELISFTKINSHDLVLEIGPGRGVITQELLKTAQEVVAIEKDPILYRSLVEKFNSYPNFKIFNQDFLSWPLPSKLYKVFANIPFNITAGIVDKFLKSNARPTEIYLILQTEAAQKYLGGQIETQNSIITQVFYDVEIVGDIDRTAFTPKPQVNISFVKFLLKKSPHFLKGGCLDLSGQGDLYFQFRDFVIYGFNQWQSDIAHAYKKIFSFDQLKVINKNLKVNSLKPSQVKIDQWLELFNVYQQFVPQTKKDYVEGFEKKYLHQIRVRK